MATKLQKVPRRIWLQGNVKKSAIFCADIELKFGIETNIGPLSSKTNINFQSDANLMSL